MKTCLPSGERFESLGQMQSVIPQDSPIHGRGLFARAPIPVGARVIEYVGERITKGESLRRCQANNEYIFALDDETDLDGDVEWNPARLINHSCEPNSETRFLEGRVWIVAMRPIGSGEEITFNYEYDLENYREHPCHCGSASCVGFMVAETFFELLRQNYRTGESAAQMARTASSSPSPSGTAGLGVLA